MDKEQSYFVEDFSNTFQSIGLQFQQSLDELAKQFSGKKLSEQIGNTISTFFNKDGKFNFASEPNIEQKDLNKNNIDDLINNKSFDMMRKIIKDNIDVSNGVINYGALDTLKEQNIAKSLSVNSIQAQRKL